jgi:uncharacterized protein YkwD
VSFSRRVKRSTIFALVGGLLAAFVTFELPAQAVVPQGYLPTQALRVMDTRVDEGGPTFEPEEKRRLHLISEVPRGAISVELNITALEASDNTNITIWPAGQARPYTSSLNIGPGAVRSNTILVDLGEYYALDMYNEAGVVDVIVDVIGWFSSDFVGMRPTRMVDTRFGFGASLVQAGTDQNVTIGGRFGVPADAKAVAMNVTAIGATEPTSLAFWPTGTPKPLVGMVAVPSAGIHGQSTIVGLELGTFSMSALVGQVNVVIDVTGWFKADGLFVAVPAQRIVDTKVGTCGVELGPGETRTFPVTDAPDVFAVAVNIGALEASENTYLTVWSAGSAQPETSNLNVMPGTGSVGAVVITELGTGGQISVSNAAGKVHVTLDVIGVIKGTTPAGDRTPCPMPPPPPPPPAAAENGSAEEEEVTTTTKPPVSWQTSMLNVINRERQAAGLSTITSCGALNRTAQAYADVLIGTRDISHTGPNGSTLQTRVAASGYVGWTNIGENLAAGQGTVDEVMTAWLGSSGHRANIMKPEFTHVGFGRTKGLYKDNTVESWFWVQNFGAGGIC